MSDNIPFEIQMEIIKRLPVKSMLQFRSVSKSWKSLIDSPQFIADYNVCQTRPQRLLIMYDDDDPFPAYQFECDPKYVSIVDDNTFPQNKLATTGPMVFEKPDRLNLLGSSQGLLCLLGVYREDEPFYRAVAFIWNPAIRKTIAIDVPVFYEMYGTDLGFGVRPGTNDPLLVKINHYDELPDAEGDVFTLSSRVWRSLRNVPGKSISLTMFQVAIDGIIYWKSFSRSNWLIVSFDMRNEEFAEIKLPGSLAYRGSSNYLSICNLRESLAVIEHYKVKEKPVCDVWRMENGVSRSFTKLFTVTTPNGCLMTVMGFRKNGEVILESKTDGAYEPAVLEVFDPRSELVKDLGIYGERGSFSLCSYMETLLLHDQADNQHITIEWQK